MREEVENREDCGGGEKKFFVEERIKKTESEIKNKKGPNRQIFFNFSKILYIWKVASSGEFCELFVGSSNQECHRLQYTLN